MLGRWGVARRNAGGASSRKDAVTPLGTNPDDGERQREGEGGAQGSRAAIKSRARRTDWRVARSARSVHGDRRLGLYARRPLTRAAETGVLGLRVNPGGALREARVAGS